MSSERLAVAQVLSEPTVMANGEFPGDVMPPRIGEPSALDAVVARGRDDDDAGARRALDRLAQRVGGGRLGHRVAERQVDDADVVAAAVGDRPVDAGDDVARQADAVRPEHPDVDQLGAGRDAAGVEVRHVRRRAADDARDVRAVAEQVRRAPEPETKLTFATTCSSAPGAARSPSRGSRRRCLCR